MKKIKNLAKLYFIVILCLSLAILLYPIDKPIDEIIERGEENLKVYVDQGIDTDIVSIPEYSQAKQDYLRAKFLVLGNKKIDRIKLGHRLTEDEVKTYLFFIRKGGIHEGIENEFEHVYEILSGSDLMKHITYSHLEEIILTISNKVKGDNNSDQLINVVDPFDSLVKKRKKLSNPFILELIQGEDEARKEVEQKISNKDIDSSLLSKGYDEDSIKQKMIDKKIREQLIESALGGILNPDPRVRLVSINILRRLIPEPATWHFINERTRLQLKTLKSEQDLDKLTPSELEKLQDQPGNGIIPEGTGIDASSLETVKKTPYAYNEIDGIEGERIVYSELKKLWRFISRSILVKQIETGDTTAISTSTIGLFKMLNSPIDGEGYCKIPMNYFSSRIEAEVILQGLRNKNPWVQEQCANSLIRIIRTRNIDPEVRKSLFRSLINSQFKYKLVEGWTDDELTLLKDEELDKMIKAYLRKNGQVAQCPTYAEDQYDQEDPIDYEPEKFVDKPIIKGKEVLSGSSVGLEEYDGSKKEPIEKDYIYEK